MTKINWGVLGTADIARGCTIPGMKLAQNCNLYAIAGRSLEKAESFKEKFGFEKAYGNFNEMLADSNVQAVYIPLPNEMHYEWVMKCIAAGKHVLCEKPLAPTAREVDELFEAADKAGVILMEAFAYLHSPYIAAVKEEVDRLGKISYLETAFLTPDYDMSNIRMHKEQYGGSFYDLGCYCTSMALWMLPDFPVKVKAVADFTDSGVDSFATALLCYEDGTKASLTSGMVFDRNHPARMDRLYVRGERGYLVSTVGYNEDGEVSFSVTVDGKTEVKTVNVPQNYSLEVTQLGRCITDGEKTHVSREFSVKNARLMDLVLDAIGY